MRKGFTLVELLVVAVIMMIIGATVVVNLFGRRTDADLTAATQQAATLLREAQSDALAQENGATQGSSSVAWGVRFSNATATAPFYALFSGSYSATTTVGYYSLPSTVSYRTSTLASGATLDIIFSPITGAASASTSIGFYMPKESAAFSSTISIASSGEISY
jgi:prepilin-type N-terminal cleavage/methylation domain-containing protein